MSIIATWIPLDNSFTLYSPLILGKRLITVPIFPHSQTLPWPSLLHVNDRILSSLFPDKASGGSIDWVKQEFKTPLVYVYELRDTGANGFVLPPAQILPNNLEIVDSIIAMFQEAARRGIVTLA